MNLKIYEKWSPIVDIIADDKPDEIKMFLAEYAEHHINNTDVLKDDLLPISMKILSKLDLDGKNCYIIEPKKTFETKITKDGISVSHDDFKTFSFRVQIDENFTDIEEKIGIDIIQRVESVLIEECVIQLNELIKDKNDFGVHLMVSNLSVLEDVGNHYAELHSLIKL